MWKTPLLFLLLFLAAHQNSHQRHREREPTQASDATDEIVLTHVGNLLQSNALARLSSPRACWDGGLAAVTQRPRNSTLHRLTRRLLKNYNKGVRPIRNWARATTIYLDLFVHAVLDVDAQNQKLTTSIWYRQIWRDEYLTWNSSGYDGIQEISLPINAVWAPDIIVSELVDAGRSPDLPFVYLNATGMIKNYKPMQVVTACSFDMYAFPFDTQNCSLTFSSALHPVQDVDLALWRSYEEINNDRQLFLDDGEWELVSVLSERSILQTQTGSFAQVQFNIVICRRPLLYVVSLLIPSILMVAVDLGSFYLPPNSGSRISFKTSVLVGYTVFKVNMADELPVTAGSTPLISIFFTVCMALLVLSLSKAILIIKFFYLGEDRIRKQLFTSCCYLGTETLLSNETSSVKVHEPAIDPLQMKKILKELLPISFHLQALDDAAQEEGDWLTLSYKVDKLLFRVYLLVLAGSPPPTARPPLPAAFSSQKGGWEQLQGCSSRSASQDHPSGTAHRRSLAVLGCLLLVVLNLPEFSVPSIARCIQPPGQADKHVASPFHS
ncbi:5-hydroxytryptamine receptor 3B [Tiliqua scincoides]|uniref:5-hydroxytryptamine receptor 3B n=1 Tax=Tiliqua scincoides TaxID=71010 RepID=UPI00346286BA